MTDSLTELLKSFPDKGIRLANIIALVMTCEDKGIDPLPILFSDKWQAFLDTLPRENDAQKKESS